MSGLGVGWRALEGPGPRPYDLPRVWVRLGADATPVERLRGVQPTEARKWRPEVEARLSPGSGDALRPGSRDPEAEARRSLTWLPDPGEGAAGRCPSGRVKLRGSW